MKIKNNFNLSLKILLVLLISSSILGGAIIYFSAKTIMWGINKYEQWQPEKIFTSIDNTFRKPDNIQPIKVIDEQSQVIEVVKKASPAVVSIVASQMVPKFEMYYDNPTYGLPDEFQQFFAPAPTLRQNGAREQKIGAGTGFIVSSDGYILTNKHVVAQKDADYTVYLNNDENKGEKVKAKVIARDPNNDLAVLKIDKTNLPYLNFGDSSRLQVGQSTIAIGYALGEFDNTVSKGVVSGLSRSIVAGGGFSPTEKLKNLIQSDAAINPGNSGGPMLDLDSNVIGVNVAMADAQNIGFAIAANDAKEIFDQVKKTGTISQKEKAFLGLRYLPITLELKARNSLPYEYGALVFRGEKQSDLAVVPGSPADKAGVVENDIILEINGQKIDEKNDLADLVGNHKPGEEITLRFYHKGVEKETSVVLAKQN